MDLDVFDRLAHSRRATRNFRGDAIAPELIERLVHTALWAPSGYNLQPTHFVVVQDAARREALSRACLGQRQVRDAPLTVVLTGDREVVRRNLDEVIRCDMKAGAIDAAYEQQVRRFVGLAFGRGPLGLGWLGKAVLGPLMGLVQPTPSLPAVHKRYWLAKQVMLAAMQFMLAAQAADLATCPIEGFDESRVRRVLGIPRSQIVPIVIATGYAADADLVKTRLPAERLTHRDQW